MHAEIEAIQAKSESWNVKVIGHHDLNGHGDGMQLLKKDRYVYLAHSRYVAHGAYDFGRCGPDSSKSGQADAASEQHPRAQSTNCGRYSNSESGTSLF